MQMAPRGYSSRIDFDLRGQLAQRLDDVVRGGLVDTKSEAVRQGLLLFFARLDEMELQRRRVELLGKEEAKEREL